MCHHMNLSSDVGGLLTVFDVHQREPKVLEALLRIRQELLLGHWNLDETNSCSRKNGCLHHLKLQQQSGKLVRIDHASSERPASCCLQFRLPGPDRRISPVDNRRDLYFLSTVGNNLRSARFFSRSCLRWMQHPEVHKGSDGAAVGCLLRHPSIRSSHQFWQIVRAQHLIRLRWISFCSTLGPRLIESNGVGLQHRVQS